jgi:hypothetical protein
VQPLPDHLSIRTFLDEVRQAGGYDEGVRRLCARFAKRQDVQNVGYLYRSLLKRNPENADVARRPFGLLEDELKAFTLSSEFKRNFGVLVPHEFPELRRDLFVHIPKTGGTSIHHAAARDPGFAVLRSPLSDLNEVHDWKKYYRDSSNALFSSKGNIFISHHLRVSDIFTFGLLRPQDRIYTIVREPVSLMVSYLNFVLTRVAAFAGNEQPPQDVLDMRRAMGLEADQEVGTEITDAVILGILRDYLPKNPMCSCLCTVVGGVADANTAYQNIHKLGIYVYEIAALKDLFRDHDWEQVRENVSYKYVNVDTLSNRVMHHLHAMSYEDLILYEKLKADGIIGNATAA